MSKFELAEINFSIGDFLGFKDLIQFSTVSKVTHFHFIVCPGSVLFWKRYFLNNFLLYALSNKNNQFTSQLHAIESLCQRVHFKSGVKEFLKTLNLISRYGHENSSSSDLENEILSASSRDRSSESPSNTLYVSRCTKFNLLPQNQNNSRRLQERCGCAGFRPCYWSSKSFSKSETLRDRDGDSPIEYLTVWLKSSSPIVAAFSITPYQAFFHPNEPVYAPKRVSLQFILRSDQCSLKLRQPHFHLHPINSETELHHTSDGTVYYESPVYDVEHNASTQIFTLPKPVIALNAVVRLVFRGMYQRQTLEVGDIDVGDELLETLQGYYLCLSNITIKGILSD
mmetsp:Transcript_1644/g.2627  ORF Transcript_1644/g.2627 Transcript_1644/m.2627 type:complete len:340 (-) Transcript_1644:360-1379(-)